MKLSHKIAPKIKLNQTLRSWLPILQAGGDELADALKPLLADNPFASVEQGGGGSNLNGFEYSNLNYRSFGGARAESSNPSGAAESAIYRESLYEHVLAQIDAPLFPTQKTQKIARAIVECLDNEGYFEPDARILGEFDSADVERVRARFAYLDPTGVGARDLKESFLFQLDAAEDVESEIYALAQKIIENFENLKKFTREKRYEEAMRVIKTFKNPPAVEFLADERAVVPDIFVFSEGGRIEVKVGDEFYPTIRIDVEGLDERDAFVSAKVREARALIDALEMRKATLYKIGLMIVEYQYDYFYGGDVKPMKLKDIAADIGRNPSTVSRAIQNKYLGCSRGVIPLKNFFSIDVGDDTSSAAIKDFLRQAVAAENPAKPLSDEALLALVEDEFHAGIGRRTITKYRKALNIGSSSERKKIYAIKG